MDIKVNRNTTEDGDLVFTITVSNAHLAPFLDQERITLERIDSFIKSMESHLDPTSRLYQDLLSANHSVKEKVFIRVLENLKLAIENEFRPKFRPICQEIYNWIYDMQEHPIKRWMIEFDPQRTKYYFDNDGKNSYSREPLDISEDKIPDEDEDEDEDE